MRGNSEINSTKILFVTPFEWSVDMYPHLYELVLNLRENSTVDYLYFSERGYWIEKIYYQWKRYFYSKKGYTRAFEIASEIKKLYRNKKQYENHKIIAIDNFIYIICCVVFKPQNVILWSHDFVSHDNVSRFNILQKGIKRLTNYFLNKGKFLMIQSKEREALFFKSIEIDTYKNDLQTFYLPVCLNEMSEKSPKSRNSILRYIQIGGINEFRSCSTSILKNFNYKIGSLCFHGFINPNFKKVYQTENYRAELSDVILSSQQLQDKIYNQFDVGVLGYTATDANFREIALASGQFAEFIRAFKPIISIGDHSLTDFVNTHKLGIGIRTIDDFQNALHQMDQNYDQFVTNVFEFSESFDLKDFSSRLADKIGVDVA